MSNALDRLNQRQGCSRAKPKLWVGGWGEEGRNQLPLLVGHRHVCGLFDELLVPYLGVNTIAFPSVPTCYGAPTVTEDHRIKLTCF